MLPPIEYGYRSGPSGQARGPGGLTNSTFTSLHWVHGGHLNPGRSAFFGRGRQSPAIGLARQYPPMPPVQALLMKAPLKEVKLAMVPTQPRQKISLMFQYNENVQSCQVEACQVINMRLSDEPPRASSSPAQPLTVCRTQRKKRSQRRQISPKMSWWSIFGAVPPQPRPPCILSVLGGAIGRGLGSIILDIFLRSICQVQPEVKSPGGSRIEGRISGCGRPHIACKTPPRGWGLERHAFWGKVDDRSNIGRPTAPGWGIVWDGVIKSVSRGQPAPNRALSVDTCRLGTTVQI